MPVLPWLIVANKMDLEGADEKLEQLRSRFPKIEVIPISALVGRVSKVAAMFTLYSFTPWTELTILLSWTVIG